MEQKIQITSNMSEHNVNLTNGIANEDELFEIPFY